MRATIHLANEQDLIEVQNFWYRIYVSEMQRHTTDPLTDHNLQRLHDPLAHTGDLFIARDESRKIIATLMNTVAGGADLGKYEQLYGLDRLTRADRDHASISTKLMVAPSFRRTRLPMLMGIATYRHLLSLGIEKDYIDCNDHLVGFFEKLGYKRHLGRIVHRDYGPVNSMALAVRDAEHLTAVASPLMKPLRAFNKQSNHTSTQKSGEKSHAA